ncbi:hypothetical protein I203_102024 [Kwoniella mangroviensis CBS 8507]|uniref:uncharacterized protein n=1 Tax=Kwoniella mangroviensis CBS 8507 TaxID=1296122 RepID=UPI00080D00AC|nr:uncharacterized protein I203_03220 [Kwoniella mangroviensis CBS 8507]OCF67523.1 hypothetical protein I203_03220 [Kwoniella mangroviensis CBS 8507]
MAPIKTVRNILMELRKICQHPYLSEPELESFDTPEVEQHKQLVEASGKLMFLKLLLPKLKERRHRVLLFSQFKIALDRIEDFLYGENIKFLRLDGDVQQAQRQKSMDLFNAPNSEYDVFLLTTRAGGVGINLATADTVILYDPDFNPHQDLQAIARSHRYGQKKKVLVFKLMVKGSVEENIINKGKKKMVLDHLVVQQMGKESEEGDIDDLLLRGAEAVYSMQGGINVPDIVYNSKNVDELIDKVEADAEAEANEMEEREKAMAEGTLEPNKNKSNQQFGFAKIWEADRNQLQTIAAEENADDNDEREINWESIIDAMEKERQEKLQEMMENSTKKKRKAAANANVADFTYLSDGFLDDSPAKKSKKGKGKAIPDGSSESEYSKDGKNSNRGSESEGSEFNDFSDSNMPAELQGLGLPGMLKKSKKMRNTQNTENLPTVPEPSNDPLPLPPHPTLPGLINTNTNPLAQGQMPAPAESSKQAQMKEDKQARKKRRLEQKQAIANGSSSNSTIASSHPLNNHYQQVTSQQQVNQHILQQRYAQARHILNLLYHVLREFGNEKNIRRWGLIALPELPAGERINRYTILAEEVDKHLSSMNQSKYFSLPEQLRTVSFLLVNREDVVVKGNLGVPNVPPDVGLIVPPKQVAAPAAPAPRIRKKGDTTSSNGSNATPDPMLTSGSVIAKSQHPQSSSSSTLFNSLMDAAPPTCQFCSGQHELRDCDNLSSMEDLQAVRQAILQGNEPEYDKTIALKEIDKTQLWVLRAGKLPNGPNTNIIPPSNLNNLNGNTNGHINKHTPNKQIQATQPVATSALLKAKMPKSTPITDKIVIEIPDSPSPIPEPAKPAKATGICPFCEAYCGMTIRDCVERNGGRKALKMKIRGCEDKIQGGDGSRGIRDIQQALYSVYKSWPRDEK